MADSTKYTTKNRASAHWECKQEGGPLGEEENQKAQYKVSECFFYTSYSDQFIE